MTIMMMPMPMTNLPADPKNQGLLRILVPRNQLQNAPRSIGTAPAATPGPLSAPAVKLPNRPKKTASKVAPASLARRDNNDLYSEVFGSGNNSDDVAGHWFQRYQNDNAKALTELINCVLLAAGCEQQLSEDDIGDPENSASRLTELEEAYEQVGNTTLLNSWKPSYLYRLNRLVFLTIRSFRERKSSKNFRELLVGFFDSLITLVDQTDVIYKDEEFLENIQRWVGIMSSSALRPFRHTATTVALSMLTSLINVMKQLDDRITRFNQSLQAESSRRGKNKGLLDDTQKAVDSAKANRELLDTKVKDLFDIVFVHRYRDIDPKIRAECIEALGTWVCNLPTVYMSPEYLRYLGWLLSDVNVTTRLEVLKQLAKVLKRDAEKLAHFIDRFRPRLVEMATRDSEVSVRVAAIAVVDVLRGSGMLEPEEVDSISKLVFDSEIRVRKAVVGFFSEFVQEFIDGKIDEIGGNDLLDELFGDQEDDDFESVRKDWINLKALAENLAAYDSALDAEQDEIRHGLDVAADIANAAIPESRVSLAAQALYEKMPEISNWQVIAGYLLFDHTTSSKSRSSKSNSTEVAVKKIVAPEAREEAILLEVLATAVKENLAPSMEHDRNKRRHHRVDHDAQEDAGLQLAGFIPRLLKKYGSDPAMAAIVLRLEHFLDLEVFQQLRQNSATYNQLLEEIATQFKRHVDQALLNEAVASLLHARQYYELEELVDSKMAGLWEDSITSLRGVDKICELSLRGNLDRSNLASLSQTLMKISKLVTVSDCVDVLEAPGTSIDSERAPIKILVGIVARGRLTESDEELDDPEDEIVAFAIKSCLFYFMWKVQRLRKIIDNDEDILNEDVDKFVVLRKELINNLIQTFSSRGFNDDLRLYAVGVACDITQLFIFLRPYTDGSSTSKYKVLRPLLEEMPAGLITQEIIPILDAAERAYAKRINKTLNDPADDDEPLDDELPPEDDEEEELTEQERFAAELKAEKILCELAAKLVMAILAKTIDHSGPEAGKLRKRLHRNKNKLGTNFKDVVSYLDEDYLRELQGGKRKTAAKGKGKEAAKKPVLSTEIVVDDDDDEDDPFEEVEPEEGTTEDLRQRELIDDPIEDDEDDEPTVTHQAEEDDEVIGD
ncbi:hypothetical protein NPX13_g6789 [Xylaria arbuscula]|uniref:SCD domain-containing protein n=1 Tax=Xylaria arbuscula TaxID=114810 RepID=A0A9W8NB75_9PEZI|nr:hypothetical protein NPX13_g6789 [Xylaria arbuscula]